MGMEIKFADHFNLWTIFYTLYGAGVKDRDATFTFTMNGLEQKTFLRIFEDYDYKKIDASLRIKRSDQFVEKHLGMDLKRSIFETFTSEAINDTMRYQKTESGGDDLRRSFIEEWQKTPKMIDQLYELNKKALETWKHPYFYFFVDCLLPRTGDLENEKKEIPTVFENIYKKENHESIPFTPKMKALFVELRTMNEKVKDIRSNDEKQMEEKKDLEAKILTWLLLMAFLAEKIDQLKGVDEFLLGNAEDEDLQYCTTQYVTQVLQISEAELGRILVENDKALYGCREGDVSEGTAQTWEAMMKNRKETFGFLMKGRRVVGNFSMVGYGSDEGKEKEIEKGEFFEADVSLKNTNSLTQRGNYILVLLNLGCLYEVDMATGTQMLIDGWIQSLLTFAKRNIYFPSIYTVVYHDAQEAIYEERGFEFITEIVEVKDKPQSHRGRVYRLTNFPEAFKWNGREYEKLKEAYKKRALNT